MKNVALNGDHNFSLNLQRNPGIRLGRYPLLLFRDQLFLIFSFSSTRVLIILKIIVGTISPNQKMSFIGYLLI